MPVIEVTLVAGRPATTIRSLLHELTEAATRALGCPAESVRVIAREVPPSHFCAGDVTIEERNRHHG
ncbi:4-oxalocrotonate tautomerase [Xylanimonas allomyrinae]|uniref:4-oxalocrotonate tautomerase n=1 Tax=Xylanimonas allomyrinae TaxID=2509459 RepID=A0A4P6EW06_9MICO|nr:tautomerase family protein [Xylanimonas allomyrinae]QAY62208.1 4-oxalocrotonate tautomerase [Xylanimonas allomyrinae]